MPRYYCDYCDTYLTHDSPSVRKQHNAGYKHKANVRSYYQQFEEQQTQSLIDQKVKEHLGQTAGFQQVGAAFHQHIAALQSGQYKPPISVPVLPPPALPIPGSTPPVRPPVLPRPTGASPGYGALPTLRPPISGAQPNGFPRPPTLTPPGAPGVRPVTSFSPTSTNGPMPAPSQTGPGAYQQQSTPSSGPFGSYTSSAGAGYTQQHPNAPPTLNSHYNSHQPFRAAAPPGPPGQNSLVYGQNPPGPPGASQPTTNSYGPPPPGGPTGYRS